MAQRVVVQLTDDIDGRPAAETVSFGLDGRSFEIDLSEKNARALRKELAPWVASARRVSKRPKRSSSAGGVDPKAVRAWALGNGYEISARGRIPAAIVAEYVAAGN